MRMKNLIYLCIIYYVINYSNGSDLPNDIKAQMNEYALKLDQIRKSFDRIGNFGKLGGVHSDGKVDAVKKVQKSPAPKEAKKVAKIETSTIKDQFRDATKSLEALMKKLDANGFILAESLLSLDLLSVKNMLTKSSLDMDKVAGLVKRMDESVKLVEEQLENVNQRD